MTISESTMQRLEGVLKKVTILSKKAVERRTKFLAEERAWVTAWQREKQQEERSALRRFAHNMARAEAGVRNLFELINSPVMQQYLELKSSKYDQPWTHRHSMVYLPDENGEFIFYYGLHNPEDDENPTEYCAVAIVLKPDAVWLVCNDYSYPTGCITLPCDATPAVLREKLSTFDGWQNVFGGFPIIQPDTLSNAPGSYHDFPANFDVCAAIGRILIECSRSAKLNAYCEKAFDQIM